MRRFLFLSIFLIASTIFSQGQIPVDTWRVHLPYQNAQTVAVADQIVYCGTEVGLFSYKRSNGEIKKLSKIDGYSDVGISAMAYSDNARTLIIGYENGNIDLVDSVGIPFNLPDIKTKLISASKKINNILIVDDKAYLACGFGIVLVDLVKREISETYIIGDGGSFINIQQVSANETTIYAATLSGVYSANLQGYNLVDFNSWIKLSGIPNENGSFSGVAIFNDKLFVVSNNESENSEALYYNNNNSWELFDSAIHTVHSLSVSNNKLLISKQYALDVINPDLSLSFRVYSYNDESPKPNNADFDNNGGLWIADSRFGLIKMPWVGEFIKIYPNGPFNKNVVQITSFSDKVFVAGGGPNNPYNNYGAYIFEENSWKNYNYTNFEDLSQMPNISTVVIDPANSNHMYGGSWGYGLAEFNNGELVDVYNQENSILENIIPYDAGYIRITGLTYDNQNVLWLIASQSPKPIYSIHPDGSWVNYEFENTVASTPMQHLINTKYNHKWSIVPHEGVFAWDVNGTYDDTSDDDYLKFSIKDEDGKVISNDIISIAEDNEGSIWLGLNEGVVVYYSPQNVFDRQNFYAQRPIIEVDGDYQYLLQTEAITSIAIDGANRKWFGTQGSGVYLMSEDGREQLLNFNEKNSPLISNNITSIAINDKNGEVFFGTDKGIVSYKGTSAKGNEFFNGVYVYPNPIQPDYDGLITITGLVENVDVKITDISGNLVYSTKANGGSAIWNGLNFTGEKVQTGVYLVFCTNDDGSKTHITKLLFVN
jgi:TSS9, PorZ, N-terminal beta-propeller domain/Two component regulator propeller